MIEQAIPQLTNLLEDADPRVQRSAGTSLHAAAHWLLRNHKGLKTALDILSKLAEHRHIRNRARVAYFWVEHAAEFPEATKEVIPILVKLTKDPDEEVRKYAERAIESLRKRV